VKSQRTLDVEAFHAHFGAPAGSVTAACESQRETMRVLASALGNLSAMAEREHRVSGMEGARSQCLMRLHLILEEAGEVASAMADGCDVQLLDALVDLAYVTTGTAVTYDLPIDAGHAEVHRSNMTKRAGQGTDRSGDRGKGCVYSPPDLKTVLKAHRAKKGDLASC
jgi:predicted HAD superfamily Cof-like phosphohydrolase